MRFPGMVLATSPTNGLQFSRYTAQTLTTSVPSGSIATNWPGSRVKSSRRLVSSSQSRARGASPAETSVSTRHRLSEGPELITTCQQSRGHAKTLPFSRITKSQTCQFQAGIYGCQKRLRKSRILPPPMPAGVHLGYQSLRQVRPPSL